MFPFLKRRQKTSQRVTPVGSNSIIRQRVRQMAAIP
jgi:hypothetical protein